MELIPHGLTPEVPLATFEVWLGLVSSRPLAHPELYLRKVTLEAAPKCISEKTSYRRVRLAYHLYPQLIPSLCNVNGFDPSPRDYRGFNLAIGSSHGFGSNPRNPRLRDFTHASTRSADVSARIFIFEPKFALSDLCILIIGQRFVVSFLPGRCSLYSNLLSLRLRNVIP